MLKQWTNICNVFSKTANNYTQCLQSKRRLCLDLVVKYIKIYWLHLNTIFHAFAFVIPAILIGYKLNIIQTFIWVFVSEQARTEWLSARQDRREWPRSKWFRNNNSSSGISFDVWPENLIILCMHACPNVYHTHSSKSDRILIEFDSNLNIVYRFGTYEHFRYYYYLFRRKLMTFTICQICINISFSLSLSNTHKIFVRKNTM